MTELEPQFLEGPSISAQELRSSFTGLQPGVLGTAHTSSNHLKVSAGTVGRSIDVAEGIGMILGVSITDQGLYRVRNDGVKNSSAFETGGIPANATANPRVDQVIARLFDQVDRKNWRLEIVAGTPSAGATLDNRTGAVSDENITAGGGAGWIRLADYLVPAGATSIGPANIRDRRAMAQGVRTSTVTPNGVIGHTTPSPQYAITTVETNGRPILVALTVPLQAQVTAARSAYVYLYEDGAQMFVREVYNFVTYEHHLVHHQRIYHPSAGHHTWHLGVTSQTAGDVVLEVGGSLTLIEL